MIDDEGHSAFWDAVGSIFGIDLVKAGTLSMVNKKFIAEPGDAPVPAGVPLLPPAAQAVIGQVHPETRPALKLLQSEGFRITDMVDIFEAGPMVSAERRFRTVRESGRAFVGEIVDGPVRQRRRRGRLNPREDCRGRSGRPLRCWRRGRSGWSGRRQRRWR